MRRRGNWKEGFAQRFAIYDAKLKTALTNRHVIWIHAVSVGEVNIATQLILGLERRLPNLKIVVSTTTSTGMAELRKKLPAHIHKIYYPIDRKKFVQRALRAINPEAIVLVEAEIWPNFLWQAQRRKIPLFLVNARLSERSFRGYKRFAFLFRPLFGLFRGVGVQNEEDARRLLELGCRPEAVRVLGNMKFDAAEIADRPQTPIRGLLEQLGVNQDSLILLGGSTHPGEELVLANQYLRLKAKFPNLFLVLAPRHFERGKEVGQQLKEAGVKFVYRTDVTAQSRFEPGEVDCLLLNTTGELRFVYSEATVVFIGKSLKAQGGQNPLEPGVLAKPIVFGPHMENFAAITEALLKNNGARQVKNEEELTRAIETLLASPELRRELGENARRVVRQNQGAIERTLDLIVEAIS